jgi:hypothetical protein
VRYARFSGPEDLRAFFAIRVILITQKANQETDRINGIPTRRIFDKMGVTGRSHRPVNEEAPVMPGLCIS